MLRTFYYRAGKFSRGLYYALYRVLIEGPDGKFTVCTVLRADLNEETRLAFLEELEPDSEFESESDDEY